MIVSMVPILIILNMPPASCDRLLQLAAAFAL